MTSRSTPGGSNLVRVDCRKMISRSHRPTVDSQTLAAVAIVNVVNNVVCVDVTVVVAVVMFREAIRR